MEKVKKIHIRDVQPVLMIAKYPRATIRFCLMFKSLAYFFFIGVVGVFGSQLAKFVQTKYQVQFSLGDIVASSMLMSVIVFTLSTLLLAFLVHIISRMMNGKGKFQFTFRALCLTYIPFIWILPILLFWMQLSPESYFIIPEKSLSLGDQLMKYIGPIFIFVAAVWHIVLIIKAIQEVQRFTLTRSIIALLFVILGLLAISATFYSATGLLLF